MFKWNMSEKNSSPNINGKINFFSTNESERWLEYSRSISNETDGEWLDASITEQEDIHNNNVVDQWIDNLEKLTFSLLFVCF